MLSKIINILFSVALIIGLFVIGYVWRDDLLRGSQNLYTHIESIIYPPCSRVIGYRLGDFSDEFDISREQFLQALQEAESIWEDSIGRDLFLYDPQGDLVVNLIYDNRQATTDKLKALDGSLDRSRASYDILKARYQEQYALYAQLRMDFEKDVETYENQRRRYEQQVDLFNKQGGANDAQYKRLEQDRIELNKKTNALKVEQEQLKQSGQMVNELAQQLNDRARELNIAVDTYNAVGDQVGEEFDEGLYRVDESGRAIDVFQFNDYQQLVRLLAHELGHALGVDHVDDPEAIMYRLNQSSVLTLATDDVEALKMVCNPQ